MSRNLTTLLDAPALRRQAPSLAFGLLDTLRSIPQDTENFLHFLGFAAGHAAEARGQLFQDLWALWETDVRSGGFFVEFGAGDGRNLSNTWLLEKNYGWSGIIADPNPNFAADIQASRSCYISNRCVWSKSDELLSFLPTEMGELSRLRDVVPNDFIEKAGLRIIDPATEVTVSTITLHDLLTQGGAPKDIDFLSIDTEGSELEILSTFDFSKWRIKSICVEHNWTDDRSELKALLERNGYRRKWDDLTQQDDWYVLAADQPITS